MSDFGLSKDLQDEDYYVAENRLIPFKWTAPEAIQFGKLSAACDVWSYEVFHIFLYETWSPASKPYGSLNNQKVWLNNFWYGIPVLSQNDLDNVQVLHQILNGSHLPSPPGCPRAIYIKMINCWYELTSKLITILSWLPCSWLWMHLKIKFNVPTYIQWHAGIQLLYSDQHLLIFRFPYSSQSCQKRIKQHTVKMPEPLELLFKKERDCSSSCKNLIYVYIKKHCWRVLFNMLVLYM